MKTGKSKISNLPYDILEEFNYRISDGEPGNELVAWLNSKPEVGEIINKLFDGIPISEENLSQWRKRGYQKWLLHHNHVDESTELTADTADILRSGVDPDKLLLTLTAAYAEMTRNWIITPGEQMLYKLKVYKNLTNGVIALQRAELQKLRLEIARERLELLREKRQNKSASSSGSPKSTSSPESATASQPHASAPPPHAQPAPQNIAPPPPTPEPRPSSNAHPTMRRPSVPPNAPPGTVISLNPVRIVQRAAIPPAE